MLQIIDAIELPKNARGGKGGSKFFTDEIKATAEAIKLGQGFVIPKMDGVKSSRLRGGTQYRFKEHFEGTGKEFSFGIDKDENLVVKCIKDAAPVNADAVKQD